MRRRSLRLMIALVATLSCTLVTGTSFASYRASMGAQQCCKSHCRHALPKRAAEQCCRAHPSIPGATAGVTSPEVAIAAATLPSTPAWAAIVRAIAVTGHHRGPPGSATLVALRTSLTL